MTAFHVAPITIGEANRYVGALHRHNGPLPAARLCVALLDDDGVVHGVGVAGIPKARMLMDRRTLEVSRLCTDGTPNACSLLYAALTRAARALGYRRLITYTLASERGASLRASGWTEVRRGAGGGLWAERRGTGGTAPDLGEKVRWEIHIDGPTVDLRWPDGMEAVAVPSLFDDMADGAA